MEWIKYYIIMTAYLNKWDLNDTRFIAIWYVIANFVWAINDFTSINYLYKSNFFVAFILTIFCLYLIPKFLLHIWEDSRIKRFFLELFYKHQFLYSLIWNACFGLMIWHIIVYLISKIWLSNIISLLWKTWINF